MKKLQKSQEVPMGNSFPLEQGIKSKPGDIVIVYTATTVFQYPSITACARAYGVARSKIVDLIITGASFTDGITTYDVPMDSTLKVEAYGLSDKNER